MLPGIKRFGVSTACPCGIELNLLQHRQLLPATEIPNVRNSLGCDKQYLQAVL